MMVVLWRTWVSRPSELLIPGIIGSRSNGLGEFDVASNARTVVKHE
jgi:hypothetical protein